jgi:DNA-binding response OmpR family regulator
MRTVLIVSCRGYELARAFAEARHDFIVAPDAARALRLASILPFDIALVDTTSDDVDTRALSAALRRSARGRRVRVVALSPAGASLDTFDGFLSSTLSPEELVAQLMRRRSQEIEVPALA